MTVEAALVLPALVFVIVAAVAGISCLITQVRCTDAAFEAARLAGRGDQAGAVAAAQLLAAGAIVTISADGDLVRVRVVARPLGGLLPGIELNATAVAALEPGE